MSSELKFTDNEETNKGVIDAKIKADERGWIGAVVGSAEHSANNIAAFVLILTFVFLMIVVFKGAGQMDTTTVYSSLTGIITLVLGFLFGKNT